MKTRAALDYEAKSSYTVTVIASDGHLTDSTTVNIDVTDVDESTTNSAPVFSEGSAVSRTVAENTTAGENIGDAVSATDADNDSLTYTLSGTDASSFDIDSASGQLKTKAALDYETKTSYTVTISVSDNTDTASITVTITVSDVNEAPPVFSDGTDTARSVAENTQAGENIGSAVTATDADNDTLTYTLSGTDASSFDIERTSGQLKTRAALDYESKAVYTVMVSASDGSLEDRITVTINIDDVDDITIADCQVGDVLAPGEDCLYPDTDTEFSVLDNGQARLDNPGLPSWLDPISVGGSLIVTATVNGVPYHLAAKELTGGSWRIDELGEITVPPVDTANLSVNASPSLTEATLNGGDVTLTLNGSAYSRFSYDAVTVSGITGVTVSNVERASDTAVTVQLAFNGNIDTDGTLTLTVGAAAIAGYDGTALTAQISVTALAESVVASTPTPLTERTLNEGVVTLTLNGGAYETQTTVRNNLTVSGITGVTVETFDVDRVSDTVVTVELNI